MSAEHDGFLDAVITNPLTMESAKRICREIKDRIATLEAERDAARADANFRTGQLTASRRHCEEATIERDRAVRALTRSGWTLTEGADEWKPPIGLRPDFEEIDRLRDALAKKQRAIDEAYAMGVAYQLTPPRRCSNDLLTAIESLRGLKDTLEAAASQHAIPESKDEPPLVVPPIGQHHPDDPLQTEWTEWGFKITKQPEEWRGKFDETHAGICVRSTSCPYWCGELLLRGEETETDSDDVRVTFADRPRVWAAICSINAKHRPKASQPAPAEPSGDRALRLVRKPAGFMHDDGLRAQDFARMNAMNEVIAECDAKEPTDA